MNEVGRRLMIAALIVLVGLVLAIGLGAGSSASSAACNRPCNTGTPSSVTGTHSATPCVRDAACSGGFVLGAGAGFTIALVVPTALAVLALAWTRLRRRPSHGPARGRVLDGGLFRPPRVLLGI